MTPRRAVAIALAVVALAVLALLSRRHGDTPTPEPPGLPRAAYSSDCVAPYGETCEWWRKPVTRTKLNDNGQTSTYTLWQYQYGNPADRPADALPVAEPEAIWTPDQHHTDVGTITAGDQVGRMWWIVAGSLFAIFVVMAARLWNGVPG